MILLKLFYEFFKTGLFSVGGGLATLPFLTAMSKSTHWFTTSDLADMIAISQSTPGPIGVNMATNVGFKSAGFPGSIIATIGLITPSVIIIILVARFLQKFKENKTVQHVFYGLRPASTALIASACYSVVKITFFTFDKYNLTNKIIDLISIKAIILSVILFWAIRKYKKHPIVYLAASAVIGILFKFSI